ncbi:hypothetical protein [Acutalibacter intestini]|uniref:hypothetical protein n=1 Tax=Acutalibacter intestini TaxID=3093659 RepID=UPI002AC96E62|nr:hypothetical protein [Acutalibacter sp. M00204]
MAIFEGTALEPAPTEEPGDTSDPGLTDPTAPVDPADPAGQDAPTGEKNSVLPVVAVGCCWAAACSTSSNAGGKLP